MIRRGSVSGRIAVPLSLIGLIIAILAGCDGSVAREAIVESDGSCSHPPLESLLESARPDLAHKGSFSGLAADSIRHGVGPKSTLWISALWEGPRGGAILAVDCEGRIRDAAEVGYPLELVRGPLLVQDRQSVILTVVSAEGTGYERRERIMLVDDRGGIKKVWGATTYERDQSMPSEGGELTSRSMRISTDSDTILLSGFRKRLVSEDGGTTWSTADSAALPTDRFCRAGMEYRSCN